MSQTLMATPTAQNQLSGVGLVYDAAGNKIQDNIGSRYTYDAENRIATAETLGGTESYGYDGDGKRALKTAGGSTGLTY